jgi:hypothetical protein
MRFCKDCKHYKSFWIWGLECLVAEKSPSSRRRSVTDMMTGKIKGHVGSNYPRYLRIGWDKNDCGPDGKYWEPKEVKS